jgi:hypothetical protein
MSKIFVGNLSFQTTQEELLATFSQFGNVEQVNIVTDRGRRMLHQAAGFLPVPKHALTFIGANADVQTQTNNVAVLPPVESSIKRWSDRFNAIAPPTPTPVKPPPEWAPLEQPDEEEPDEEEEPDTPDDNEPMTTRA